MKFVVFDLDGTLVDVRGLEAWMLGERTDFDLYHQNVLYRTPIEEIVDEWRSWEKRWSTHQTMIITGRGEQYAHYTWTWLKKYALEPWGIRFRGASDTRPGVDVKRDIFRDLFNKYDCEIEMAYEDDPDIYEMMVNEFAIPTILVPGFPSREKVL